MRADTSIDQYYQGINTFLSGAPNKKALYQAIVDAPFQDKLHSTTLDLGIIVLTMVNAKTKTINRITYSSTGPGETAVKASTVPFHLIKIPLDDPQNITAKAIRNQKSYKTSDWQYTLSPALSPEAARFNQAESGMDCSFVYPLREVGNGAALVFSFYQPMKSIGKDHAAFMKKYSKIAANLLKTK